MFSRKADHLRICRELPVEGRLANGFEAWRLEHNALPELSPADLDLSSSIVGKRLSAPVIISALTGGTDAALEINRNLATAAQALGLAMVVGSQRAAIEDPSLERTYAVRRWAPDIPLFANLGAVQLNRGFGVSECRRCVEMLEGDGLVLHLNLLQEMVQPEGDRDFRGLAGRIGEVVAYLGYPVMVKEVGWGLSASVAQRLWDARVRMLDVAGAGGTSWAAVEASRESNAERRHMAAAFSDWGIPTAKALVAVREVLPAAYVVASGGVRDGVEAAKAIALGANAVGLALPLVAPAHESAQAVERHLAAVIAELRAAMLCTASANLSDLRGKASLAD